MEYRQLGSSGLLVSELSFGTMTFGNVGYREPVIGSTDVNGARRQVDICLDAGVNLIDTADVYAAGKSEEIVGQAIEGRRERLLLATKVRFPTGGGPNDGGLSRHNLVRSCEASLKRLRTDYIDLYQMHGWDGQTPVEETLEALDSLVRAGKVRYVGCSNFSAWHVMKSLAASERLGLQRYVAQQINYTLLSREAEYELVPVSLDQGLGILVWSPLAGGLLTGKYRRNTDFPAGVRHASDWDEPPVEDWDRLWRIVEALVQIAAEHDVSAAQVALRYLLDKPGVTSVVIGARTDEQLVDNLGALQLELSDEDRARLDTVSARPLLYPYWHQAKSVVDRAGAADLSLLGAHGPSGEGH
jgi:aryl-alcohol dehydrogenase-like predicted oxidoreductase